MAVNSDYRFNRINSLFEKNYSILMLKQVVHILATVF
jgi:hypothetical protein